MNMTQSGFFFINKPTGISSYDCIRYIKKQLSTKQEKIGHAGTLDPFASGLLIIAYKREATRLLPLFMKSNKTYKATAKLGELTDTLDHTGTLIETNTIKTFPTDEELTNSMASLCPMYTQIPPLFSALKIDGKPLYHYARKNNTAMENIKELLDAKARMVHIHALNLISYSPPFFTIETTVSKGTYIRSLMNDIAQNLGTYATTYQLTRTSIGPFHLNNATPLFSLTPDNLSEHLVSIDQIMEIMYADPRKLDRCLREI